MRILFNSKSNIHKRPFGCIHENEPCHLSVHIPKSVACQNAFLVIENEDGFLMRVPFSKSGEQGDYELFDTEFSLFSSGLYFYYFYIQAEESSFSLYRSGACDTNIELGDKWQLTCIKHSYRISDCFKGKVYYQIFPDRFYKERVLTPSDKTPYTLHKDEAEIPCYLPDENGKILNNDFFGGNLAGIEKKLSYLSSLGVGVIYLNPIFAAFSNHRYDTSDYMKIDPLLGTEKDFISLCNTAHSLSMKIILDGVFSHTGADSVYFDKYGRYENGAYKNPDSPYREWYQFTEYPEKYTSWWGIDTLPCVNELNPSFMDFIINKVAAHWLSLGADGFRIDVADELPDEFILALHRKVHEVNPDAIVLGEVWEDASNKISYGVRRRYFADCELDSVMNYPFRDGIIDFLQEKITSEDFSDAIMTICENYPAEVLHCLMNSLSTHDTPRILNMFAKAPSTRKERAEFKFSDELFNACVSRERLAVFLQFVLPGCPCIYYGDEAGAVGFEDPFNRGFFPWGREYSELTAFYRKMSALKNNNDELKIGDTLVSAPENGVLVITRSLNGGKLCAALSLNGDFTVSADKILFSEGCDDALIHKGGFILYRPQYEHFKA